MNHLMFPKREECKRAIHAAIACARQAVAESGREVEIAASIGPIRQTVTEDDESFEDLGNVMDTAGNGDGGDIKIETF